MATHRPVLDAAVAATNGPLVEFGSGYGSTPLLHARSKNENRLLVTADHDAAWLDRFRAQMESPLHRFVQVSDWTTELAAAKWDDERWSVVFVDQGDWEARANTVRRFKDVAELIVVHDCDYFPEHGLFGRSLATLRGERDRGERDYGDVFDSWREFFPPEPWPYKPTGPPTLLGSNVRDVREIQVEYRLPPWWQAVKRGRHLVPRRFRQRVAEAIDWGGWRVK